MSRYVSEIEMADMESTGDVVCDRDVCDRDVCESCAAAGDEDDGVAEVSLTA